MKRKRLTALALAAAAAICVLWFVTHFERVETTVWVGPSAAARSNPYLAVMRFAERVGWHVRLEEQPARLQSDFGRNTIVLANRRAWLTTVRAQAMLRSAEEGAHLILEPETIRQRDVLLDLLELRRRSVKPTGGEFEATFHAGEAPLKLAAIDDIVIDLERLNADRVIADTQGPRLVSMRRGAGRITVVASLQRFDNRRIGEYDHAELLRRVLALGPTGALLIVRSAGAPGLWGWLTAHASGVMAAAAAAIVLALWRTLPRFGPVLPAPEPGRRQLLEHLRAVGRFHWSRGARSELLGAAREQLERHVALAAPRLAHLPPQQRYRELSAQLDTDPEPIERAFHAIPRNARDLVQITATLASIHAGLRSARRPPRSQQRRR